MEVLNEVYVQEEQGEQGEQEGQGKSDQAQEKENKGILPHTGDIAIIAFVILMIVSATGMVIIIKKRK